MALPFDALRSGATLLTANARLARQITLDYDRHHATEGHSVWESADILPWASWLERCWHACVSSASGPAPVLLGTAQEEILWERIIEDSPDAGGLLSVSGAAGEAMKAYALLHSWELSLREPAFLHFDDPAAFLGWAREFEQVLKTSGWMSSARLEREIADLVGQGRCPAPGRLIYAGFDELSPAQQHLVDALRSAGSIVDELPFPALPSPAASRIGLRDASAELMAAAQWARSRLQVSPEARIGVVVPDLAAVRPAVDRIFDETLHPSFGLAERSPRRAFHLSVGPPLAEVPVISAALSILAFGRQKLASMEAGLLLRSPFLAGSGEELGPRALVDAELRRKGLHEVSLTVLARVAEAKAPELARHLRGLRRALAALPTRQGASSWSRIFSRLLRVAGWPGDRAPDSFEHQAIERWNDLLSGFASVEVVSGPMDYSSALARLRHMARQTRFAPADEGAPVQVMGILEAAGSGFDHLWVTGIDDRVWPPPPRPNPFLPGPLQRERGLPHSSADRELAYARAVTTRLLASAAEVLVSYPLRDADSDLRPSPLIGGLPETSAPIGELDSIRTLRRSFPGLLQQEDSSGPRVPEGALQRGGMGIMEKQAACPFRAFAEFRLGARPLEEPSIGLSPQERGKVVHAALQILWSELKTRASLMASAAPDLAALVSRSVRQALVEQIRNRGAEAMPHLQSLEQRRLERLLATWLEIERSRSPFELVASERKRRIRIGGMEIDIQVDRVDSLEDGRHVIIDYKAGDPNPNQWEGDRPDAPQLPLYAATHESPLAAVAFARLAPGESGFKGLGEDAGIPGVAEYSSSTIGKAAGDTLAAHIEEWARTVERLALEFAAGSADVVPKRYDTCDHCALPALCRIGEIQGRMGEEFEGEDADG